MSDMLFDRVLAIAVLIAVTIVYFSAAKYSDKNIVMYLPYGQIYQNYS